MRPKMKKVLTYLVPGIFIFLAGYTAGVKGFKLSLKQVSPTEKRIAIDRVVPPGHENVDFSLFWEVWDEVSEKYVDPAAVDETNMVYGAISGMVSALGDPYTVFLPPKENKSSKDDLGGAFEGVGIQLGYTDQNVLSVISPLEGSPAFEAGVKAGDVILKIQDQAAGVDRDTGGITLPEAVDLIRGPKGTQVILTLSRDRGEPFEVNLRRDTIVVKSVDVAFRDIDNEGKNEKVALLKLNRFGGRTEDEWSEAINQIKAQEKRDGDPIWVVLDLRNNPGGYLDGAVWTASEFIESGVVVKQENRDASTNKNFEVNRKGKMTTEPMVILVNEGTASAAEILAGALRDHDRAVLVGEKTFGKGSVQQPEDLPGGAGIHITVGRWLLPSGKWVDKEGVTPEISVENDDDPAEDEQLEAALAELVKAY